MQACRALSPLLIATGEAIPLRGLEGVPGLPGAPQDEAGLTRKFETSHVGGATFQTPPIPLSALEKDPSAGCDEVCSLGPPACRLPFVSSYGSLTMLTRPPLLAQEELRPCSKSAPRTSNERYMSQESLFVLDSLVLHGVSCTPFRLSTGGRPAWLFTQGL